MKKGNKTTKRNSLQHLASPTMSSRRVVNIATISEEDIFGEEIGEDGMVELVSSNRLSGERSDTEGDDGWNFIRRKNEPSAPGRPDSEKRSSLVERDGDEATGVSSSILRAISSFDGPSLKSSANALSRSRSTESLTSSSLAKTLPSVTPSASTLKRTATWRGSRAPGSTMNLSGKFLTELTLYDPFTGPEKSSSISLGVYIATDQTMGDHFVYKMSPVSPITGLKIQQQDRLLKVNDISVAGWSHNCLVEFIRSLPLTLGGSGEWSKDRVYEMHFSMEFRKAGKAVRSAEESPSSKRVEAKVQLRNRRATVLSVHEAVVRIKYSSTSTARLKLKGDPSALYLKTSTSSNNVVLCNAGQQTSKDDEVYFRLHHFDVSPPRKEKGDVVVIETPGGNGYLHATSPESIAVMHVMAAPPCTFLQMDVRFFHISKVPGSTTVRIRNIHTGHYLSASKDGICLVKVGGGVTFPMETEFEILKSDQ